MIGTKKQTILKILYVVYLILLIGMIFGNSMESKEESAAQSTTVLEMINHVFESIGVKIRLEHNFVRKVAHVIEFMTLGASFFGFLIINNKVEFKNCVYCAFFSCLVAMTDETIQYFYERGSMLTDVWLDLASAVLGILLAYLVFCFVSAKLNKKRNG